MKGVVLAGGLGSRLRPLTSVTNKHLLPVYNQPMIYFPIQTLVNAGIQDIMIVTGGNSAGDFLRLLGNGKAFGLKHLNYAYQEGEGGIGFAGKVRPAGFHDITDVIFTGGREEMKIHQSVRMMGSSFVTTIVCSNCAAMA